MTPSQENTKPSPRRGILAAGNWIVDHVNMLDAWPAQDALANILSQATGNGGSPCNILKCLARLGASYPLATIGLVGNDTDGRAILDDCRAHRIDTTQLKTTPDAPTSHSDVMTDSRTGRRTFFHHRGANALLGPEHFDFTTPAAATAKIFHLGYILLLDRLDAPDPATGKPAMREVFQRARAAGLHTSLDCVSETARGDRFQTIVRPVLPEVDTLFINEYEAMRLTNITATTPDGRLDRAGAMRAIRELLASGVRRQVVLHAPDAVCAACADGTQHWQPSLDLPPSAIKGAVGAGDAFAAGVLHGLHEDWPMSESLRLGVCAAAACLGDATASDGILPLEKTLALAARHGFRKTEAQAS